MRGCLRASEGGSCPRGLGEITCQISVGSILRARVVASGRPRACFCFSPAAFLSSPGWLEELGGGFSDSIPGGNHGGPPGGCGYGYEREGCREDSVGSLNRLVSKVIFSEHEQLFSASLKT